MADNVDIKAALSELKETLEGQAKEQFDKHGEILADTDAKLDKLNGMIADAEKARIEAEKRIEEVETRLNTPPDNGDEKVSSDEIAELQAKAFSNYLRTCDLGLEPEERTKLTEAKVLSAASNTTIGYVNPPAEFVAELIKPIDEFSPVRSVAAVRSTSRGEGVNIPRRTGIFSAAWVAESGTRSETTGLTVGLEEIRPHEMYAEVHVTQQELEDAAFDLESYLAEEFGMQFAVAEASAFVSGTGVARPEGFVTKLTADSRYTALGHASTIDSLDGLIDLQHAIKSGYVSSGQGRWGMRRATIGVLRKAKGGDGQYLWEPSSQQADPMVFLGDRIVEMSDMPAIASNAYSVVYGNFRLGYQIVDRIGMSIMRDPYTSKSTGAVEFSARKRVGGQVVLPEALRLGKIATS